jgi:hypothetical protein
MHISRENLKELAVQVARKEFGYDIFKRRKLMQAVEKRCKGLGYWESGDDQGSGSAGLKSKGLANIDWAVSTLKQEGRLLNPGRDLWQVP